MLGAVFEREVQAVPRARGLFVARAVYCGALLGIVNGFVRPLAIILTFPITLVTLGLFLLVVNAGMLSLVAWVLPGFFVAGFWSAFWGALIVSLTGWVGSWFIGPRGFGRIASK